jgi:flagellar motor switch protein FliG
MSQAGIERSAILLMTVGEDAAGQVLRYLSPGEVTQLAETMRQLGGQPRDRVSAVLDAFQKEAEQQTGFGMAPEVFLGETLSRALGRDKAAALLNRLENEGAPLKQLAWMSAEDIARLIEAEPAPVVATVLAHVERDQAAGILMLLPARQREDALLALTRWQGAEPQALRELSGWLASRIEKSQQAADKQGEALAAELLSRLPGGAAQAMRAGLSGRDPELAVRLETATLAFQDLARLDGPSRTRLFKSASARTLLLAMKGADPGLVEALGQRMGPTAAQRLKDDLDALGAIRIDEIDAAQAEVVRLMRELAGQGRLKLERIDE